MQKVSLNFRGKSVQEYLKLNNSGYYTFIYPQEGMSVNLIKQSNNKPKLNLISTVIYFGECYLH